MKILTNGTVCFHLYEHVKPTEKAREEMPDGTVVINTDVLIEGGWQDGDIDYAVVGDAWYCPKCKRKIVTGFGKRLIDYEFPQEHLQKLVKQALEKNAIAKATGQPVTHDGMLFVYAVGIKRKE